MKCRTAIILTPKKLASFMRRVSKSESGCWIWIGAISSVDGYGRVCFGEPRADGHSRAVLAHRVAYLAFKGPIDESLELDHLCRNRACVNPEHLEAVTHAVNIARGLGGKRRLCMRGHELTEANTYLVKKTDRRVAQRCRKCHVLRQQAYMERRRPSS